MLRERVLQAAKRTDYDSTTFWCWALHRTHVRRNLPHMTNSRSSIFRAISGSYQIGSYRFKSDHRSQAMLGAVPTIERIKRTKKETQVHKPYILNTQIPNRHNRQQKDKQE